VVRQAADKAAAALKLGNSDPGESQERAGLRRWLLKKGTAVRRDHRSPMSATPIYDASPTTLPLHAK